MHSKEGMVNNLFIVWSFLNIMTKSIYIKVEQLDELRQFEEAKKTLHGRPSHAPSTVADEKKIPHFTIDINIDGVKLFENTDTMEFLPILLTVHSIRKSFDDPAQAKRLTGGNPAIVGFFHGKEKPPPKLLLGKFLYDLSRLCPHNEDLKMTAGRQFTVSLRCVRTDGPMRSYLKRTKGHSGYHSCDRCIQRGAQYAVGKRKNSKSKKVKSKTIQLRDLHAPLRTDEDFLTYTGDDHSQDNHVLNANDVSPFVHFPEFGMVSGFVIDSMHTMEGGAFLRILVNLVHHKEEGGLDKKSLGELDRRIMIVQQCKPNEFDRRVRPLTKCAAKYKHHELRQFLFYLLFPVMKGVLSKERLVHIMMLQQSMLLLGGFNPNPVSTEDITEASRLLKGYVQQCIEYGWPVRFTTHQIIHLPEDVSFYKCGVECLSAYPFENFQRVFKNLLRSGNLATEQIRNRLIEKKKYALPTGQDGMILTNFEQFKVEAARLEKSRNPNANVIVEFIDDGDSGKTIKFPQFTLSNRFPNNVCLMKNGSIVVCKDFIESPEGSGVFLMQGLKFRLLENCYTSPFPSSKFGIYFGSKIETRLNEWNLNGVCGKIYAIPSDFHEKSQNVPDISIAKCKWYLSPIFHTLSN